MSELYVFGVSPLKTRISGLPFGAAPCVGGAIVSII